MTIKKVFFFKINIFHFIFNIIIYAHLGYFILNMSLQIKKKKVKNYIRIFI